MVGNYGAPGVYIEERPSGSMPLQGVGTAVAAFVGFTETYRADAGDHAAARGEGLLRERRRHLLRRADPARRRRRAEPLAARGRSRRGRAAARPARPGERGVRHGDRAGQGDHRAGHGRPVTTKTVENLFVDDYRYLQDFYRVINFGDPADPTGAATMAAGGRLEGIVGSDRHEAGPVSPAAPEHGAAAAPGPRRLQDTDIERIVEAVEPRLLRQLERRGGRYAGVF